MSCKLFIFLLKNRFIQNIWHPVSQFSHQSTLTRSKISLFFRRETAEHKFWGRAWATGNTQSGFMTALNTDYRWTFIRQDMSEPTTSRISTLLVLFPQWSNVSKFKGHPRWCHWVSRWLLLFYFLNLSSAVFWPENTAAFFSLSLHSLSIFILSSTVFLLTSCRKGGGRLVKCCSHSTGRT